MPEQKQGLDRYGWINAKPPYDLGDIIITPYRWDEDDNEGYWGRPNFFHKQSGLAITWYKYPFRGAYSNKKITYIEFIKLLK